MKERPILFSGPMVRAILEGRKTQTRRIVKPQPTAEFLGMVECGQINACDAVFDSEADQVRHSPYGQPGDRLWVRETTIISPPNFDHKKNCSHPEAPGGPRIVQYLASEPNRDAANDYGLKATPSIFMPRWASRITLEIVSVRVERLQDISEEDATLEGCSGKDYITVKGGFGPFACEVSGPARTAKASFRNLWGSINGPDSWALNPWVWVIEFRRVK